MSASDSRRKSAAEAREDRNWHLLASRVVHEMREMRISREEFAGKTGKNVRTLDNIVNGRPTKITTVDLIDVAIEHWEPGTARQILVSGKTPRQRKLYELDKMEVAKRVQDIRKYKGDTAADMFMHDWVAARKANQTAPVDVDDAEIGNIN